MLEEVNRDVTIPVEASADGKRNAWMIHCGVVQHVKAYCVCIHLCKQRKEGRLPTQYSDCSAAIGKKECPALKMRKEELAEGHAIYFRERNTPPLPVLTPEIGQFPSKTLDTKSVRTQSAPAKPSPASSKGGSVLTKIDSGSYAKAINIAIESAAKPVEKKPEATATVVNTDCVAKPGESLLEMARRLMGK